jgi:hypothetical protein
LCSHLLVPVRCPFATNLDIAQISRAPARFGSAQCQCPLRMFLRARQTIPSGKSGQHSPATGIVRPSPPAHDSYGQKKHQRLTRCLARLARARVRIRSICCDYWKALGAHVTGCKSSRLFPAPPRGSRTHAKRDEARETHVILASHR